MNSVDNTNKLRSSTNYYFCNVYLPDLFFHKPELFMDCLTNEKRIHEILNVIFTLMSGDGFDTKDFTDLKYEIRREDDISGILLAIPNSTIEPECNFVALCFRNDKPRYYESELYAEGYYGLCSRNKERAHMNHGRVIDDIKTFDDMWKAINPNK